MINNAIVGLTHENLQFLVASLSGLSDEEAQKAKLLFIKNEVSRFKMRQARVTTLTDVVRPWVTQRWSIYVPFFWPIMWSMYLADTSLGLQKDQIRNALSVWSADLGEEGRQIEQELDSL